MEIPKIEISFSTGAATKALARLAQAGIDRPELLKGIAAIEEPLFDSHARQSDEAFLDDERWRITIAITPSEPFRKFLEAIETLDGPAIHRTRE